MTPHMDFRNIGQRLQLERSGMANGLTPFVEIEKVSAR